MLSFFKKIFTRPDIFQNGFQQGLQEGRRDEFHRRMQENEKIRLYELEEMVGKLIIVVSNEVENICVGYGEKIAFITKADNPMLQYTNIVTGQTHLAFGIAMPYTEQKFKALNEMDKNALIALFYFRDGEHTVQKKPALYNDVEKKPALYNDAQQKPDAFMSPYEWDKKVQEALLSYQNN